MELMIEQTAEFGKHSSKMTLAEIEAAKYLQFVRKENQDNKVLPMVESLISEAFQRGFERSIKTKIL